MREAIWGSHTHVDYDRGLAYCIGQVRTALGDSGDNPRFVQTLPKRGFRFLAPVSVSRRRPAPGAGLAARRRGRSRRRRHRRQRRIASAPASGAPPAPAVAPAARGRSGAGCSRWRPSAVVLAGGWWRLAPGGAAAATVAVSIFDNETGDPAYDAFVQGLSDVVVTRLTHLAPDRVGVIGNAAPLRQPRNIRNLKALAAALDADYIVLGQLQRQDDDLRFIVHFIRLRDEVHLSAQRFIRPPGEVRQFETDVVAEAERAVGAFVADPSGS